MICDFDSSPNFEYPYECLVIYTLIEQECASLQQCCASIRFDRSLSLDEIAVQLTEQECRQNPLVSGIALHCVLLLNQSQPQPTPQIEYWLWLDRQGLPYTDLDICHSETVEAAPMSQFARLFQQGQVQAVLTLQYDRF